MSSKEFTGCGGVRAVFPCNLSNGVILKAEVIFPHVIERRAKAHMLGTTTPWITCRNSAFVSTARTYIPNLYRRPEQRKPASRTAVVPHRPSQRHTKGVVYRFVSISGVRSPLTVRSEISLT